VFGMNVHVPGQGDIGAFWIIIGVMVVSFVGLLAVFRRRGWL
jgi:Mg2+ and Co2+ transporter CorA